MCLPRPDRATGRARGHDRRGPGRWRRPEPRPGSVPERRRRPMRHLHPRDAHGFRGSPRHAPGADREGGHGRARRGAVPVHRVPPDHRGCPWRGRAVAAERADRRIRGRCPHRTRRRRGPGPRHHHVRCRRSAGRGADPARRSLAPCPRPVRDRRPVRPVRRTSRSGPSLHRGRYPRAKRVRGLSDRQGSTGAGGRLRPVSRRGGGRARR